MAPGPFQRKTIWQAVTGLALFFIGWLIVKSVGLISMVLGYLQPVLVPLAVAGIIAYLLDPVVHRIQRKWNLSRVLSIGAVFGIVLISATSLIWFVGDRVSDSLKGRSDNLSLSKARDTFTAAAISEKKQHGTLGPAVKWLFAKDREATLELLNTGGTVLDHQGRKWHIPRGKETLEPVREIDVPEVVLNENGEPLPESNKEKITRRLLESDWVKDVEIDGKQHPATEVALYNFPLTRAGSFLYGVAGKVLGWLGNTSGELLGFLGIPLGFVMVPIYLYYFLKESDSIKATWQDYIPLKASKFKTEVVDTLQEINGYLISFFRGQVLVAFIDGILVGFALLIYGLPYGLLIGLVMAVLGIIPYIGNILCLIPACVIAYFHSAEVVRAGEAAPWGLPVWGYVLGVLIIFVVVQQINSLITAPKIVGDSVGLHPMTVIFSILFWALLLGGFLGALLAVPLTASIKVLFRRYLWDKKVAENFPRPEQAPVP